MTEAGFYSAISDAMADGRRKDPWELREGDCVEAMQAMDPCSVDAVVCDPPYHLTFMGKGWDHAPTPAESQAQHQRWAVEALRVLKPGGHLLAFGGTRTYHRLACALEDAGFEIRDCLCWLYGSGFPKSLNLSGEWSGWGTALKPAHEPIVLARKPLSGTVAGNVLEHGTGGLNVDGCRIETSDDLNGGTYSGGAKELARPSQVPGNGIGRAFEQPAGRWPANVVLDEHAAAMLDEQAGDRPSAGRYLTPEKREFRTNEEQRESWILNRGPLPVGNKYAGEKGGASRFFYIAKASRAERNAGLEGEKRSPWTSFDGQYAEGRNPKTGERTGRYEREQRNHHPTVKPVSLMRWLVRLVTPPGGLVLDPFVGSGTTGVAAVLEGFRFLGLEREPEYVELAMARVGWWQEHGEDALRIVRERETAEAERAAVAETGQLDLGVV